MHANHPEVAEQWEKHTPPGKLPKRVNKKAPKIKEAYDAGSSEAMIRFGLKVAANEIRLKIPKRQFHGMDKAFGTRNAMDPGRPGTSPLEPQARPDQPTEMLAEMLQGLPEHHGPNNANAAYGDIDRPVAWSGHTDVSRGAV